MKRVSVAIAAFVVSCGPAAPTEEAKVSKSETPAVAPPAKEAPLAEAKKAPAPAPPKTSKSNQLYVCMTSAMTGPHVVPKGVVFGSWGRPYGTLRDPEIADSQIGDGPDRAEIVTISETRLTDAKPCAMVTVQRLVGFGNNENGPISAYPPRAYQASWSGLTDQGDEALDDLISGGNLNGVLASDVKSSMVLKTDNATAEIQRRLGLPEATEDRLERKAHDRARGL